MLGPFPASQQVSRGCLGLALLSRQGQDPPAPLDLLP